MVKTFEIIGTVSMERFCSDEGYVPTKFISEYKNRFYNTFLNADDILKQKNYPLNKDDKLYEIYVKKELNN